jgi:hypothetical protein
MIASAARAAALAILIGSGSVSLLGRAPQQTFRPRQPDFDRMLQQQTETDQTWRAASEDWHLDPFHADMHPSTK